MITSLKRGSKVFELLEGGAAARKAARRKLNVFASWARAKFYSRSYAMIVRVFDESGALIVVLLLRVFEIARGGSPLPSPKAEYGFFVTAAFVAVFVVPYVAGARFARLLWRSRIRFYRNYQHR
jgi:hypothetical protein